MEERKTEQVPRSGWRPGFYMKPKHIGLVFCVLLVGCMVAFGAGFIAGMGYKSNEQVSPYVAKRQQAVESPGQGKVLSAAQEESLTFYSTIRKNEPAPMIPAPATTQAPAPAPAAPPAATGVAERTGPAPRSVAPTGTASPGTNASVVETYSVQVASFLKPERAERLIEELTEKGYDAYIHPFEAPGRPLWYRVKVGKFNNRDAANLTRERLGTPDAMITRE